MNEHLPGSDPKRIDPEDAPELSEEFFRNRGMENW
jgi:hypothetical protein